MSPSGVEGDRQISEIRPTPLHETAIVRPCVSTVPVECHAHRVGRITADRSLDGPECVLDESVHEGEVATRDQTLSHHVGEGGVAVMRPGHHQQAGCIPVEAVDDSPAALLTDSPDRRISIEEAVHESAA